MSIEDNKRLVTEFNRHFATSDIQAVLDLMTENVLWWINGDPALFPITGTITKAEFADINREMHSGLRDGMTMSVVGMVAEGDHVAAELRAHAVTRAGRHYDNDYHMLYTVHDGRIAAVREYTDLMTVADVFALPTTATNSSGGTPQPDPGRDRVPAPSLPA